MPAMASVGEVAGAVAALIARHEALRTTYVPGEPGGRPRQRVAGSGVLMLEACSLGEGEWGPGDRPAVAGALVRWLGESPDPGCPVRVAVAVAGRAGDRLRRRVHAPGGGPRRDRDHQARLRRPARRVRGGRWRAGLVISRWTRRSLRRRPPSGPGPRRRWTTCGSSPAGSRAACMPCRGRGPAVSRWRWSCRRRPRRWRCGRWRRGRGPAGPASCWRRSARWSPAGPAIGNWSSRCCQATVSSATWRATSASWPRPRSPPSRSPGEASTSWSATPGPRCLRRAGSPGTTRPGVPP